jgi:hypothetical protein
MNTTTAGANMSNLYPDKDTKNTKPLKSLNDSLNEVRGSTEWSHKHSVPFAQKQVEAENDQPTEFSLESLDRYRITAEKDIPKREIIVQFGEAAFAADCNISAISAAAKAGKSAICGAILSGCFTHDGSVEGFPDIHVKGNIAQKAVLHIDTEQSDEDQQTMVKSILRRSAKTHTPDYFYSYNFRIADFRDYYNMTRGACNSISEEHNGIHLIVIDGGADFIESVNDEAQTNKVIAFFTELSIDFECPVIVIVHLNPSTLNTKERGHFGSALQRKCFGLVAVTKDGDVSKLESRFLRRAAASDVPAIHFQYSKERGYHVQVVAENKQDREGAQKRAYFKGLAEAILSPPKSMTHTKLVVAIIGKTSISKSTAMSYIDIMEELDMIVKSETDGLYRLKIGAIDQE